MYLYVSFGHWAIVEGFPNFIKKFIRKPQPWLVIDDSTKTYYPYQLKFGE